MLRDIIDSVPSQAPEPAPAPSELPGGFNIGDVVYSTIRYKKVKPGDKGTVVGPCDDLSVDRVAERVLVKFENGLKVNMLASVSLRTEPSEVRAADISGPYMPKGPARGNHVSILHIDCVSIGIQGP